MNVAELIEIALAGVDDRRVEVTVLEPAEISTDVVGSLATLVFELLGHSISLSAPGDKILVAGSFDEETYLVSVSGGGVGISDGAIGVLNRMIEDPELTLGIASIARLAARHDLTVRFTPGASGATARVAVPANLVSRIDSGHRLVDLTSLAGEQDAPGESPVEFVPHELAPRAGIGRFVARSGSAWSETEAFLEKIFAPLRQGQESVRLVGSLASNSGLGRVETTALRVRVPGESFPDTDDDSPSTAAAEAAVDIRSALSTFDEGRRSAEQSAERDSA